MACLYDIYIFGFFHSQNQNMNFPVYVNVVKYSADETTRSERQEKRRAFEELFAVNISHGYAAEFILYELLYEIEDCNLMPCIECVLKQQKIQQYILTMTDICTC